MPPTSKKTKSLLEQIADISDPRPKDFDIENAGIADNAFIAGYSQSEDEESEDEDLKRGHYIEVGKSTLRRQQGIGELGPKYTGSRVSRKDLYDDQDSDQSDLSDKDVEMAASSTGSEAGQTASEGEASSSESEDESDEDGSDSGGASNETRERIRAEMKKLEEGEKALLSSITQTAKSDVEKGQHVLNQTRMWEGSLDARIRMQKLVTAANELPQFDTFTDLVETHYPVDADMAEDANQLEKAQKSVKLLLRSIIDLRTTLIENNLAVDKAHDAAQPGQKRKSAEPMDEDIVDAMWKELEGLRSRFKLYRDESLEKWGNKVQISANAASLKKFKAVNQGIMYQINQTLAAEQRLIERTQLKRVDYKIIGKEQHKSAERENEQSKVDAHLKDTDPEIFDDTDFYQQLLRELIESRMVDSNDSAGALGTRWAAVNQRPQSKKRNVDTKASKGRRIRYHVMEKLQNFMPPIPTGTWHEDMVNELFSSLLGQKVPKSVLDAELEENEPQASTVTESLLHSGDIDVIDNGSGISEASLDLLAKRGHTSKISLGCRGNSLAAIATVSAQLKICTRIQGSLVACQLEISQDKKNKVHVAREPGTTVSVILPLCKVPVRYSLIKSQSAHIKAEIREWLNAYHLANYKIEMSLVYAGITAGSQNCQRVINFPGALSLQSAVSRFIGKKHSESIVYVEYPAKRSYSLVVASKSSQLMKGITFEGVFASKSKGK
ncbi:rRNA-processing protein bfr2 [Coemansia brasiliensis]|uniref:Protein BFR2 n=1 Tax=Coemansia brasiliensis TaxID=2650707 RepID=A0A9W8I5Y8_9FUNG|nr:rRNA-processing protein bfr2 [Coemansia brasiliensis]